jgi:hypothetical protein
VLEVVHNLEMARISFFDIVFRDTAIDAICKMEVSLRAITERISWEIYLSGFWIANLGSALHGNEGCVAGIYLVDVAKGAGIDGADMRQVCISFYDHNEVRGDWGTLGGSVPLLAMDWVVDYRGRESRLPS